MDRTDLTLAIAAALLAAVALGWLLAALTGRLNGRPRTESRALAARLEDLEARLAEVEADRDAWAARAAGLQARLQHEAGAPPT